jgi:hypothetical protein
MTDGSSSTGAWQTYTSKFLIPIAVGAIGGVAAFVGFFVNFFGGSGLIAQGGTSLMSAGTFWYDLVPICAGLATLALFAGRVGFLASGLPFGAIGIAFTIRYDFNQFGSGLHQLAGALSGAGIPGLNASGLVAPSLGAGFWLIVLGSALLAVAWLFILGSQILGVSHAPAHAHHEPVIEPPLTMAPGDPFPPANPAPPTV